MKTKLINLIIFAAIIFLAAFTRIVALDKFPNGFTGDEAQQGYSAYSILKTGRDEWGEFLPLFPRGFGDYKPPLYTYLTIPSIAIFGLSIESVRLPSTLVGILTVVLVYFLTYELIKDQRTSLLATFLLAISPWHIQISRTAWEGNIGILTFSLGLLFYLKSGAKNLIFTSIFWGLTLYSYHSFRAFTVLFLLGLIIFEWRKLFNSKYLLSGAVLLIFLVPLILNSNLVLARSSDVGIFSQEQIEGYFKQKNTSPINPLLDRVFDNKITFVTNQFFTNYLSYFSPDFYFSGNRPDNTYLNFPYFPLLYPIEFLFWIIAIFALYLKKIPGRKVIILWFLLSIIPASLTVGIMNANRAPTLLPLVSIISALGINTIFQKFPKTKLPFLFILIISFIYFIRFYFISLPQKPPDNLRFGYDIVFKKILDEQNNYNEIVISKAFTEPQIFIAFYDKLDPQAYQKASIDWLRYEKADKRYLDQLESWNLDKFYFEDVNWKLKDSNRKNALIISKSSDFPDNVEPILNIKNSKNETLYKLVTTKNDF